MKCDKWTKKSATLLIQETRSKVAFKEGDLKLALKLARAIDNPSHRARRLIEMYGAFDSESKNAFPGILQEAFQVAVNIKDESERLSSLRDVALAMQKCGFDLAPIYEATIKDDAIGSHRTDEPSAYAVEKKAEVLAITGHFDEAENVASQISEPNVSSDAYRSDGLESGRCECGWFRGGPASQEREAWPERKRTLAHCGEIACLSRLETVVWSATD